MQSNSDSVLCAEHQDDNSFIFNELQLQLSGKAEVGRFVFGTRAGAESGYALLLLVLKYVTFLHTVSGEDQSDPYARRCPLFSGSSSAVAESSL